MGLKERFEKIRGREINTDQKKDVLSGKNEQKKQLFELKTTIHRKLIEQLDLDGLGKLKDENESRELVRELVASIIEKDKLPISGLEKNYLIEQIEHETFGLGPLEPLLADTTVDEVLVNGPYSVFIERFGKLEQTNIIFKDEGHLRQIIDRIVSRIGRRVDESSPMVDARLKDGSRVNAIIPPLAVDGSSLSIRKFKKDPLRADDLIRFGSLTKEVVTMLEVAVKGKLNILISGGTGTGKTTLLNILSSFIPDSERILTIEDAAELQLQQSHVVRLETRPPNIEGKGMVSQRDLVKNSLRMRPDRIIVGEVRGAEALDMLQAMNTGHEGSLTTVHANTARDALSRIETMVMFSESNLTHSSISRQMANAFHLIVQITRYSDGVRRISSVSEITGMEGEVITMQDIALFRQTGLGEKKNVLGHFEFTGIKPQFIQRFRQEGILDSLKLESDFLKELY
jgi:pilus assembly protein CpaF